MIKITNPILLVATLSMAYLTSCSVAPAKEEAQKEVILNANDFVVDAFWPKPLPNGWILGETPGIHADKNDNIWIIQRPASLSPREVRKEDSPYTPECCSPAPSVIQFDQEGNVLQAWQVGDTTKSEVDGNQLWVGSEHGIYVDDSLNVWIGNAKNHMVMKYTSSGELLLQIGINGQTGGSNDTTLLGGPADMAVDMAANEVFIADGYANRRVIVFDANTGAYKRHWGGFGEKPHDEELPSFDEVDSIRSFKTAVHAISLSADGLLYVVDRSNSRIQIFEKDGTYVKQFFVAKEAGPGTIWDVTFSRDPKQSKLYVADAKNMKVWVYDRQSFEVLGSFGSGGRNAGQFGWVHCVTMDSEGNLYTSEVKPGLRVQKFNPLPL
ncbi:6-bladed beta-propeller [Reichenbachiella ulvae]|uniref:6-bladed beta-propeller n=1 Tax=Reichenbachiella ulvae TaxID=2980104 RepID=A0ABT3CRU4_9BACT|nr:6-bladed beta-propeller [Reichenbachiella ulvae]MCV9386190.1 6-bladed beta-propeller [Reichenbachiella ulvae]